MPRFLIQSLKHVYKQKGKTGAELDHAVYGTLNNIGAMHGSKETAKGRAMDAKHEGRVARDAMRRARR